MSKPPKIGDVDTAGSFHSDYHTPVLLQEVVEGLDIKPAGIYVDCTFGGGGHSRAILQKLGDTGKLIVFDQDEAARKNLPQDDRVLFIRQNFRHLQKFLRVHKTNQVDGILADLGVSSYQFDEAARGFSTRFDAALDMRMDQRQELTAADILNNYPEQQLHKLFEKFGEVTNAKTLAKCICEQRLIAPLKTINQFKQAVSYVVKGNPNKYFAQVFQALRIEVNEEIRSLEEMLQQSLEILKPGGRIAIITFHSLEDRIVKNFFRQGSFEETPETDFFGRKTESPFLIITRKPVVAATAELRNNPRSRSAKLRIASKK